MLDKKAQTAMTVNQGVLIIRLMFMIFVSVSVVFLVFKFVAQSVDVKPAEGNILLNRLIFSPGCLAYTDTVLNRSYPGIVDMAKFNSSNLDSCMYFGEDNDVVAANLTLVTLGTGKVNSTYYNEEGYILLYPRAKLKGTGGAMLFEDKMYVLLRDGAEQKRALLTIKLLLPNN